MSRVKTESNFLDITGVFLSVLCAIHCTVGPLLILFVPALGGVFDSELFHLVAFLVIVPVAGMTFIRCYKKHKSKSMLALAAVGIGFLFAGLMIGHFFVEHACCAHGHVHTHNSINLNLENIFTIAGSFFIVWAHVLNIKNCRCLKEPGHGECSHT